MLILNLRAIATIHATPADCLLILLVCLIAYSIDISEKVKENNNYKSMRGNYTIIKKGIVC